MNVGDKVIYWPPNVIFNPYETRQATIIQVGAKNVRIRLMAFRKKDQKCLWVPRSHLRVRGDM
jgi:hypothetical protein